MSHHTERTAFPATTVQVLAVESTGEKLTPQVVSMLVEPFQRGTERIRTDHAGVGLGLAIVKSIAHAHDGTLTATPRAAGDSRHGATTRHVMHARTAPSDVQRLPMAPAGSSDPTGAVTLLETLEKQLGLKLEREQRPLPVLVVDHVEEQPRENG